MLRYLLPVALLMTSSSVAAQADDPFHQGPKPVLNMTFAHDAPLVCAIHFIDNIQKVKMGDKTNSTVVEEYIVKAKLDPAKANELREDCIMFDLGAVFYDKLTAPQDDDEGVVKVDPRGTLTAF